MATWIKKVSSSVVTASICICMAPLGCRQPAVKTAPLAPEVVGPIKDLTEIRAGNEISLNWTVPRKGTIKLAIDGSVKMRVCRLTNADSECIEAGHPLSVAVGRAGTFAEELPQSMTFGPPRVVYYSLELLDRSGKPTGIANRVPTLAGAPPPLVDGLTAEVTGKGVILRWRSGTAEAGSGETIIRLRRTEGVTPPITQAMREGLAPFPPQSPEVELLGNDGTGSVIDPNVGNGRIYQYRALRVFRVTVDGQTLELDGPLSNEVQVSVPSE